MDAAWEAALASLEGRDDPRALELADKVGKQHLGELDVVVAGSGFMALYYIGVHSVLERVARIRRFAGASSGAMLPMELCILGTAKTTSLYERYGCLQDSNPASFAYSAWRADRHWKKLSEFLFSGDNHKLVDRKVYASVTRITWRGFRNRIYSEYPTLDLARSVYYATGTLVTSCDGYTCTDGGVTNGCPLFRDNLRPQLVVRPARCGISAEKVAKFSEADVTTFIRLGQDDILDFLTANPDPTKPATNASTTLAFLWNPVDAAT